MPMKAIDSSPLQLHQETVTEAIDRMTAVKFKVLVADDSVVDQILAQRRLSRSCCLELVGTAADGDEVKDYLTGNGKYADRKKFPFPDLLLLDVDMPRSNGFEVLAWVKSRNFPSLRIVMLSGHSDPEAGV